MGNHGGFGREIFWAKGKRRWQVNLEVNFDSLFNLFNRNSSKYWLPPAVCSLLAHILFFTGLYNYIYIYTSWQQKLFVRPSNFPSLVESQWVLFTSSIRKKGSAFNKTPPTVIPLMNPLDDHLSGDEFLSFRKALNIKKSHKNLRWKEINLDLSWLFLWYKLFGKILKNCHDNPSWYNLTTWIICL